MKKPESRTKLEEVRDTIFGFIILAALGWFGWSWLTGGSDDQDGTDTAALAAPAKAELTEAEKAYVDAVVMAQAEKEKAHGFQCLSAWNGSHRGLERAVKDSLNDPDSFEHVETLTWPVGTDGRNQIMMTFRAKNGFGGVITSRAIGTFDNTNCDAELTTIE